MKTNFNWNNYNLKRNKEAIKIHKYNLQNKINFLEKGVYKNVRDIYALSIIISKLGKKTINLLDYGGNLMSHANLRNKINTKNINFYIFNPYNYKNKKSNIGIKIKIINNINQIVKKKFDLVYLGSVIQYMKNFESIKPLLKKNSKYVLITHTPITFGKNSYAEPQLNEKKLIQTVHKYSEIKQKLFGNFNLIFKSINDFKYSGLKKRRKKSFSINLLLKKNNTI